MTRLSERHLCRWPGCTKNVPPTMYACTDHWFKYPKDIRARIWRAYRPGQEKDLVVSDAYKLADEAAQAFAIHYDGIQP